MKSKLLATLLPLWLHASAQAQHWELARDENNIKVYKANSDSSKYKIIKVEAKMQGTIKKLMAILKDVGNNKNWVYNTKESHLIQAVNENELLYYAETRLPWPFSNRDVVIRMHFECDSSANVLKVKARGEPGAAPEISGRVRVPKFRDYWSVKFDGVDTLNILYFLEVNPGGYISPAVANLFVTKGPYETFHSLAKQLKK
jgi:START domain-containing protein